MLELMENKSDDVVIKVIGVGDCGGNAIERMIKHSIEGFEFIAANTDSQALRKSSAGRTIQFGANLTKGLGAGANPEVGRLAAEEDRDMLRQSLEGADMVFIVASMGGGTGTGAAPIVAELAKELEILTVALVTKPFPFEGRKRNENAENGISELSEKVDSLFIIPNDKVLKILGRGTSLLDGFKAANNITLAAVQGIAELITRPGLINLDFADVQLLMYEMGMAAMGSGIGSGADRAKDAVECAISSPFLEDVDLSEASGILVNITSSLDISVEEFEIVGNAVKACASENATVAVGAVIDNDMTEELRVTIIATGLGKEIKRPKLVPVKRNGKTYLVYKMENTD